MRDEEYQKKQVRMSSFPTGSFFKENERGKMVPISEEEANKEHQEMQEEISFEVRSESWKKFKDGGIISDDELDYMIDASVQAIAYLEVRPEFGIATFKARYDLESLLEFKRARSSQYTGY